MDLVREVLLKLEALPLSPGDIVLVDSNDADMAIEGFTSDEVGYHLELLRDAGFFDSPGSSPLSGGVVFRALTWEGHEFIDMVRDPEVWKRTREGASKVGGWTFGLLKDMGSAYLKHVAKERLGLDL
jgi:hypothetical protein